MRVWKVLPEHAEWFTEEWSGEGSAISFQLEKKLYEKRSRYQTIEVFETRSFGRLLTLDGLVMLTDRDNFVYHEMLAHPALFSHPAPRDVLIIGGGDCGTLREVLKHGEVRRVEQVEIDEEVTRAAERFFPRLCESNADPRARLHFKDGSEWVEGAQPGSYDLIIVDGSDPLGPAAVLFSEAFFAACHRALRSGGLICGQSESPLFHMDLLQHVHRTLNSVGFHEARTLLFPQCVYPSGWWSATLACKDAPIPPVRETDAERRPFETLYYNTAVHRAASAMPEFVRQGLGRR
jgi:spermidine synthase